MIPIYKNNRLYSIFFMIYMTIGAFVLMRLVLATIYTEYINYIKLETQEYIEERNRDLRFIFSFYNFLRKAFKLLDFHENHQIELETLKLLFKELNGYRMIKIDL